MYSWLRRPVLAPGLSDTKTPPLIGQGSYATLNMQRMPEHQRLSFLFYYSSKPSASTLDAMSTDPLGSSYLVKRLSAASSSLGSTMGTADVGGGGCGVALTTRGSLTPSRAPVKKVTSARWLHSAQPPSPVNKDSFCSFCRQTTQLRLESLLAEISWRYSSCHCCSSPYAPPCTFCTGFMRCSYRYNAHNYEFSIDL